jgi:para-nitrobenzyl esterase
MDAWLAFAAEGDPGHADLGDWPGYEPSRRATMVLGPACGVEDDPLGDERRAWEGLL